MLLAAFFTDADSAASFRRYFANESRERILLEKIKTVIVRMKSEKALWNLRRKGGRNDMSNEQSSVFVRKSTGLVREASFWDAAIFTACFSAPVGTTIAFSTFWALGAYPGTNLLLAILLAAVFDIPICIMMAYMASAMPRTGGDYVWVSRIIHPRIGMISSVAATLSALIGAAYWARIWGSMGWGPSFVILGNITNNQSLIQFGHACSGTAGTFILGFILLFILLLTLAAGTKRMFKIQNFCFLIGMIGTVLALIVFAVGDHSTFVKNFNDFARQYTASEDSYQSIIETAKAAGYTGAAGKFATTTAPTIVCIFTFMVWNFWSVYLSGEMKGAGNRKRQVSIMFTALIFDTGFMIIGYLLMTKVLGSDFMKAINFLSTADAEKYPLPTDPYFSLFSGLIAKNPLLNTLIAVSFLFWNLPALIGNTFMPIRSFFAWSFDRVLPKKLSEVDERTHAPLPAIITVVTLVSAIFIWSNLSTSFNTLLSMGILCGVVEIVLVAVAAIRMPYSQKDLYRTSPANVQIGKVPVLVITAVLSIAVMGYVTYLLMAFPSIGISSPAAGFGFMTGIVIVGLAIYQIASSVQKAKGIDISLAYKELPPE